MNSTRCRWPLAYSRLRADVHYWAIISTGLRYGPAFVADDQSGVGSTGTTRTPAMVPSGANNTASDNTALAHVTLTWASRWSPDVRQDTDTSLGAPARSIVCRHACSIRSTLSTALTGAPSAVCTSPNRP